jgi:hypothetical protein
MNTNMYEILPSPAEVSTFLQVAAQIATVLVGVIVVGGWLRKRWLRDEE